MLLQGDGFQITVQHLFKDGAASVWEKSREGPQGLPQPLACYSQQFCSVHKLNPNISLQSGLASGVCDLWGCTGLKLRRALCCHLLEILNSFWARDPTLSFCPGPSNLCSWSSLQLTTLAIHKKWFTMLLGSFIWPGFLQMQTLWAYSRPTESKSPFKKLPWQFNAP